MKKDDFIPFDDVADSMAAAASRLGVPLQAVKVAKRTGCDAFRGSRVHLGKLREWLASAEKESSTSDNLLMIVQNVAQRVSEVLARCPGKRFRTDSDKLCQAIHNGFAAALCIVEPDSADGFLRKSGALFESVFKPPRETVPRDDQATQ
jgi:hypothetical protein